VIDYSTLKYGKRRPKALDVAEKRTQRAATDKAENAKARKRAKGRCEVRFESVLGPAGCRCISKDTETHHLLGGIGRRNTAKSILAQYKLRVCAECHREITQHILQPTTASHDALSVRYRRMR
jgi:hypothetical protein